MAWAQDNPWRMCSQKIIKKKNTAAGIKAFQGKLFLFLPHWLYTLGHIFQGFSRCWKLNGGSLDLIMIIKVYLSTGSISSLEQSTSWPWVSILAGTSDFKASKASSRPIPCSLLSSQLSLDSVLQDDKSCPKGEWSCWPSFVEWHCLEAMAGRELSKSAPDWQASSLNETSETVIGYLVVWAACSTVTLSNASPIWKALSHSAMRVGWSLKALSHVICSTLAIDVDCCWLSLLTSFIQSSAPQGLFREAILLVELEARDRQDRRKRANKPPSLRLWERLGTGSASMMKEKNELYVTFPTHDPELIYKEITYHAKIQVLKQIKHFQVSLVLRQDFLCLKSLIKIDPYLFKGMCRQISWNF